MDGFGNGGAALAHNAAVAANPAYSILPALPILPVAFAFVYQLAELGATVVVLDLVGGQARHHIVAVGQKETDQPND